MGVNFVIIIENLAHSTQEEVNKEFKVEYIDNEPFEEWTIFNYEGKIYASWNFAPRYFQREEYMKRGHPFIVCPPTQWTT